MLEYIGLALTYNINNFRFDYQVFTELRKQREDKERFNRVGSRVKSDADLEEIMDGLQEQVCDITCVVAIEVDF